MPLPKLARHIVKPEVAPCAGSFNNPPDEGAEAEFMAKYLPRATSRFSPKYVGTHLLDLPAELLQAIASQVAIPCTL